MAKRIVTIALTGGPSGGKDEATKYLRTEVLKYTPAKVLVGREVATDFMDAGVESLGELRQRDPRFYFEVQQAIMMAQLAEEQYLMAEARALSDELVIILLNRGTMDGGAYIDRTQWLEIMRQTGHGILGLRDRYDGVIHMVTAAKGAEAHYGKANNLNRYESIAEARERDGLILNHWIGHPHLRVVENNGGSFEDKLKHVLAYVLRIAGIPQPLEIERKFRLFKPELGDFRNIVAAAGFASEVEIWQSYVSTPERGDFRIRLVKQAGDVAAYATWKRRLADGVREEIEERISPQQYFDLENYYRVLSAQTIRKRRTMFYSDGHYFELDEFLEPACGLKVLEAELLEINEPLIVPAFLGPVEEVTNDRRFLNRLIAEGALGDVFQL